MLKSTQTVFFQGSSPSLLILSDQFAAWHDDATAVSQYSHTIRIMTQTVVMTAGKRWKKYNCTLA